MKILFKLLISASYLIYLVFFFLPDIGEYYYSLETYKALSWVGYGEYLPPSDLYAYVFLIAYTVAFVGMYNFKLWSRTLFIVLTGLSVIFTAIQGAAVLLALDATLSYLTNLLDGATIVIIYLTSIDSEFKKNA